MSATINENAVEAVSTQPRSNDPGWFRSHIAPTGPVTGKGHQPGRKVSPKDNTPEFQTKVLPPGSAPEDKTFYPRPVDHEFPPVAKYVSDAELDEDVPITTGEDTVGPTDSVDLDKGLGKPLWGELSSELRHDGMHKRKREKQGMERVGAGGGGDKVPGKVSSHDCLNERDPAVANQRALERTDCDVGEAYCAAGRGGPAET